ncbi:MAG: alpha/beta fold hydrolase [Deltaproteobacteria bacterium]|nr:alpha/beta fold hydrolase [Deltaproteobacteria bacterium]
MLLLAAVAVGCASAPVGDAPARQVSSEQPQPTATPSEPTAAAPEAVPMASASVSAPAPDAPAGSVAAPTPRLSTESAALVARRPYRLLRPASVAPGARLPLVVYLHGLGSSGRQLLGTLELRPVTDRKQIFIAAPDGSRDSLGRRFWNASNACCDFDATSVDDVAYLTALIDDVLSREPVDPKRVVLVGYSNGGFMAYRLACELGPRIAAVAVFSGAVAVDAECAATGQTSLLHVHGDADHVVRYEGGRVLSLKDRPPHLGAPATVAAFAARNGCEPQLQTLASGARRISDKPTIVQRHRCGDRAVELWTVRGGGHLIGMSRADVEATLQFLLSHKKP